VDLFRDDRRINKNSRSDDPAHHDHRGVERRRDGGRDGSGRRAHVHEVQSISCCLARRCCSGGAPSPQSWTRRRSGSGYSAVDVASYGRL
jgi:hypothetical protein